MVVGDPLARKPLVDDWDEDGAYHHGTRPAIWRPCQTEELLEGRAVGFGFLDGLFNGLP